MKLLFPCHPLKARQPDPDYADEVNAAVKAGFVCEYYNLDLLRDSDVTGALAVLPPANPEEKNILHRGWMMSDVLYAKLCAELVVKGYVPVVTPEQYDEAHYLPSAYRHLVGLTPESAWIMGKEMDPAWALYQQFIEAPAIVKDFVKSAKHRWKEACFIPPRTGREQFEQILRAFLEARGGEFNKGIVLRRYHELVTLEQDIRGQPVHEEYRIFFWNGELLAASPPVRGNGPYDQMETWSDIARRFQSRFIAMDVARQADDKWIIIEVGDGGVSGLPLSVEPEKFYAALWEKRLSG